MKRISQFLFISCLAYLLPISACAQQKYPSIEEQIAMAVLAAPESTRAGAHVFGFNEKGEFVTLREGTNHMVVRSDDPTKPGFEVVAYPKDVEPFMKRGRDLRKEGKNRGEIFDIREKEMDNGSLQKPGYGSTLHIYYGEEGAYDTEKNALINVQYRSVIYTPLATPESTGLPLRPDVPGQPWIMFPGLYRAHIMIMPPAKDN